MPVDTDIIQGPLLELWSSVLAYVPTLLGAILVFLLGLIIAQVLRSFVLKIVELLRVDELADKFDIRSSFEKVGLRLHIGRLLGWIVKWFFIIASLIVATDILGWDQVTDYLTQVVTYIPNVIIAVIILPEPYI